MTIETVRRCDSCTAEVTVKQELWTVGVVVVLNANPTHPFPSTFNRGIKMTNNNRMVKDHWMDLCEPCMTAKGLKPNPASEEPAKEPDTLDDLLREIVKEEVETVYDGTRE